MYLIIKTIQTFLKNVLGIKTYIEYHLMHNYNIVFYYTLVYIYYKIIVKTQQSL